MQVHWNIGETVVTAHKIELIGYISHFSAWFSVDGKLIDGERKDRKRRVYPITEKMRARLSKVWPLAGYYAGVLSVDGKRL